ncbi:glycogen/starch/alpha-glucan phosphorylase [Acidaminobacter sp. JC074]|uniref:glycogen/starch/alpha-glucan phosphorylase n=1 Tax=Acidaminobacter sp. JC074 TaxID=2530199 RepID=UPI001F0DD507|nr:glycogen/starch/alpha-glucan phosphorylase [Acidaminobacter sp. JC074]MCH4890244.1 glycogen/starch/alpha-glucan phosphorylase [Acidaminobacter sp. JC074]
MVTKAQFKKDYLKKLTVKSGRTIEEASRWDQYHALASMVREYASMDWVDTNNRYDDKACKQVFYFSIEFLTGKFLMNNLINLGLDETASEVLDELGLDLEDIASIEKDQGLGNGGLGRLAACFMDSMAALAIPGHGCGIRYNYGLFEQKIINGYQVEFPDRWLNNRNVWEVKKADKSVEVHFYGDVKLENGRYFLENTTPVLAVPYDTPVVGYKNDTVNTLRLWSAQAINKEFDYSTFSRGEYMDAFKKKYDVESISQVLYPNDSYDEGKVLRLKQEYFFVSAGIQGIIRSFKKLGKPMAKLYDYISIHINDTHPSMAIPELMRILMDEEGFGWDESWSIVEKTCSYTNHTILSEALEKWPVEMFSKLLPRIYMIIEEINKRFCLDLFEVYHKTQEEVNRMAVIGHGEIRMAHLAIIGSHSINGVARLHTEILKNKELKDFYNIMPAKFNNKTNGITHRRWLINSNPELSKVITKYIGDYWIRDPQHLRELMKFIDDKDFRQEIDDVKRKNKEALAAYILKHNNIVVNPDSIFDVHAKRLHEYKRQTLNILHIMYLYNRLLKNPDEDFVPRTFIFAAKAAPSYYIAKQTIKLINTVADLVNNDTRIKDKIKVVFLENYSVSLAEILMPAADVSEQISTTTKEASGTGNMKFMMNGAVTIATLDGANVEIHEQVGEDNIVLFGLTEEEVYELYERHEYKTDHIIENDPRIKEVLDQLINGFLGVDKEEFQIIYDSVVYNDEYFVLKDFDSYAAAQERIGHYYTDEDIWLKMAITNIAHSGVFSSDKTIQEYASGIWETDRVPK